jgi:predicted DNA-binding transcriptional regulator AlpA
METLLTTHEVAQLLGVSEISLRKWRILGTGPKFVRCVGNVRYRSADIEQWVAARVVSSTSQSPEEVA